MSNPLFYDKKKITIFFIRAYKTGKNTIAVKRNYSIPDRRYTVKTVFPCGFTDEVSKNLSIRHLRSTFGALPAKKSHIILKIFFIDVWLQIDEEHTDLIVRPNEIEQMVNSKRRI